MANTLKKRPTRRSERKATSAVTLSNSFRPRFWESCDGRSQITKEITRRYRLLCKDSGADSYQKELLCQRAIFLAVRLETLEVEAAETGDIDFGSYTQAVNSLQGILKSLGLAKQASRVAKSLDKHIAEKYGHADDEGDDD
jgi:hypothetical protein